MIISFSKNYDKLEDDIFTTFRSVSYSEKLRISQIVDVFLKKEYLFSCNIISLRIMKIRDIPQEEIMNDTKVGNEVCRTTQEFIDFLNKFRRFKKIESDEEELVKITLEKRS